ncbi:PD40 domain-containing protein [Hugenholtzia roseola]|uniref:PD40 domain-containing protein n=1 Tax=Hugenholtzia roseola TaxID=1002 RepID=UPI0004121615|nr:PD40 domain-containing protein [Hugenholtzia roseola]
MKKTIIFVLFLYSCTASLLFGQEVVPAHQSLESFSFLRDFCVSASQDEIFFTIESPSQSLSRLVCLQKKEDKWSEPTLLPFSGKYQDLEPFLSYDEKRLYFSSNRPTQDSLESNFDIWYVERKDKNAAWSAPINMGAPINSAGNEFYPTLSENQNLYFTSADLAGFGKDDIYVCYWAKDHYLPPQVLDSTINSKGYEFNAFISKDEKYLIYTKYNAEDGLGSGDLYVAQKNQAGTWEKARNLGAKINSKQMDYCPFYDEKNKILYFTSRREVKPENILNWQSFQDWLEKGENGLSKLYKVSFDLSLFFEE